MPSQVAQPADADERQAGLSVRTGRWDFTYLFAVAADQLLGNVEIGIPRHSHIHAHTIRHVSTVWE